ncbi:GAF and ANTAR domain-containing protein [Terrabacter sp. Soil811]|uniref:GAF and ANTAR domain-containing protein n=1 Tax=Terrabacter sp. Soil811 TaxID=1736419 RepID=UPI00138F402A|nr:GAF and ANTAR domain-containing protein [Terrabacter sp. Soil811]
MEAMARAASTLVCDHDVTDVLAQLLTDAAESMDASAAGMLLLRPHGVLEVLTATSHRGLDLELYQAQERRGPCAEAATTDSTVVGNDLVEIRARWPDLAPMIEAAGYLAVEAHPLHWHGQVLGALNLFHDHELTHESLEPGQAFADVATLVMLTPSQLSQPAVAALVEAALTGRTVIEQAKGVLAYQRAISTEQAYALLLQQAREARLSVTRMAETIVRSAYTR